MAKKTKDALKIIDQIIGNDAELCEQIAQESVHAQVARMIYDARTLAGLTQAELAKLIGAQQPTIARLEDGDYEGHSLRMLRKIADALESRIEMRLVPNITQAA